MVQDFVEIGGSTLLITHYNSSPLLLLSEMFPNYEWLPWKFQKSPPNYWNDVKNQRKFLEWAAKQLNITELNDWHNVTNNVTFNLKTSHFDQIQDFIAIGGGYLLKKYSSLLRLLASVYPTHDWTEYGSTSDVTAAGKKSQYLLKNVLKTMFPADGNFIFYFWS
jgi:hypothetical protein